eukprot:UN05162
MLISFGHYKRMGVMALELDSPTAFSNISHNDTISVMTHYDDYLGDASRKEYAETTTKDGGTFLPYQSPTIIHHINEILHQIHHLIILL